MSDLNPTRKISEVSTKTRAPNYSMARELSQTDIVNLESILNYHFNKQSLLQEAVRAPQLEFPLGNKRLALLGDAVLTVALLAHWYNSTPDSAIGKYHYQHDKDFLKKVEDFLRDLPC